MRFFSTIKLFISNKVKTLFINKNSTKMGKTKEELKTELSAAKEELSAAKDEKKAFEKENKLEKGADHSKHEKLGKKWSKINDVVESKQKKVDKVREELEALKKSSTGTRTTYEYPKEITSASDKKKYRAKMRAAKRKAEKEASGETKPKKEEKAEKKEKSEKKEKKVKVKEED